jgi:hypothetical protein
MSTYSTTLRLELIGAGQQDGTWGDTTNSNLGDLIEAAITNSVDITFANATYTLTAFNGLPDEARNAVLNLIGTNVTAQNLIAPAVQKTYIVVNNTGANVTIKTSGGTGVSILDGATQHVWCDGTDFYASTIASGAGQTGTGNLVYSQAPTINAAVLTGTVTVPTANVTSDTTVAASTAFVRDIVPTGIISLWSGSIATIPSGWLLCDGSNGTPDLRDRFVVGAGSTYVVDATGGAANVTPAGSISGTVGGTSLTEAQMPRHFHQMRGPNSISAPQNDQGTGSFGLYGGGTADDPSQQYGTFSTGSGASSGGTTTGTANGDSHNHSAGTLAFTGTSGSNLPPYYALAYIMKA